MRAWAHTLGIAAVLLLLSGSAGAAGNPLKQAEARVARAVIDWEKARTELSQIEGEHRALAHRIHYLKKNGAGNKAALDRMLKDSVTVERKVSLRAREVSERERIVRQSIDEAFRKAASEFKRSKPQLRSKNTKKRSAARQALRQISQLRNRLKAHRAALTETHRETPKSWRKYDQKIDPDDSPEELRAKADFVADHRDKFKKKRARLLRLIEEARQEREIARLASNFQQDLYRFDESARTGRVARGSAAVASARNNGDAEVLAAAPPPARTANEGSAAPSTDGQNAPQAAPTEDAVDVDPNLSAGFNTPGAATPDESTARQSEPPPAAPPTTTPNDSAKGTSSSASPNPSATVSLPKEFSPNQLLNLDLERINASQVPVSQLVATLQNLDRLDKMLAKREKELTRRAKQLEHDEKKDLGVK